MAVIDPCRWRRMRTAVQSGLRAAWKSPVVFTTSLITTAAGLVMLGAFLLIIFNMRSTLERFGGGVNVVAFLPVGADPRPVEIEALEAQLQGLPEVQSVAFISSDQALERLRGELGDDVAILQDLEQNPLPASFELRLDPERATPAALRALATAAGEVRGIEEARYGEEWVAGYERALGTLERLGVLIGAGLLVVLGFMVGGTVRLAVHARQDEIQIQRLVGASGVYVRLPFYVQGAFQGAIGGLLATFLLYLGFRLGLPLLGDSVEFLVGRGSWVFLSPLWSAGLPVLGMGLGLLGAVFSLLDLEEAR